MKKTAVLIVEDEPKVADFIQKGLEVAGYRAEVAVDGELGLALANEKDFDCLILDLNLPKLNGIDLCRAIRVNNPQVPIIMLTALSSMEDKLVGFQAGADDYLVKPFEFRELLARILALLKRSHGLHGGGNLILKTANLELDRNKKTVKRDGQLINLTAKEFSLLEYLMLNKGRVVPKSEIAEKIWGLSFDTGTNVIEVYINFLRKKIDKNFIPPVLFTQVGFGYTIKDDVGE